MLLLLPKQTLDTELLKPICQVKTNVGLNKTLGHITLRVGPPMIPKNQQVGIGSLTASKATNTMVVFLHPIQYGLLTLMRRVTGQQKTIPAPFFLAGVGAFLRKWNGLMPFGGGVTYMIRMHPF